MATKKKTRKASKPAQAKAARKPAKTSKPAKSKPARPAAVKVTARPVAAAARPPVKLPPRLLPTRPERKSRKKPLTASELNEFRKLLLELRDRIVDDISFLAGENLNRSQRESSGDLSSYSFHMADQGTDNFDREFALNRVSSEQDLLYEIDEAISRINSGTYGICEISGEPIEKARLKVMPYTRFSVRAQEQMERGKTRYRPFGPTLSKQPS